MTGRPGTLTAYRWELRKLVAQKRTYIGIGAAALLPVLFVVVMALQKGGPYDAPLGHNLRRTGIVLALVVLNFASRFGAQLVTALVAGDIVAAEDSGSGLSPSLSFVCQRTWRSPRSRPDRTALRSQSRWLSQAAPAGRMARSISAIRRIIEFGKSRPTEKSKPSPASAKLVGAAMEARPQRRN